MESVEAPKKVPITAFLMVKKIKLTLLFQVRSAVIGFKPGILSKPGQPVIKAASGIDANSDICGYRL
jgi:hypothetical protein